MSPRIRGSALGAPAASSAVHPTGPMRHGSVTLFAGGVGLGDHLGCVGRANHHRHLLGRHGRSDRCQALRCRFAPGSAHVALLAGTTASSQATHGGPGALCHGLAESLVGDERRGVGESSQVAKLESSDTVRSGGVTGDDPEWSATAPRADARLDRPTDRLRARRHDSMRPVGVGPGEQLLATQPRGLRAACARLRLRRLGPAAHASPPAIRRSSRGTICAMASFHAFASAS